MLSPLPIGFESSFNYCRVVLVQRLPNLVNLLFSQHSVEF